MKSFECRVRMDMDGGGEISECVEDEDEAEAEDSGGEVGVVEVEWLLLSCFEVLALRRQTNKWINGHLHCQFVICHCIEKQFNPEEANMKVS